MWTNFCSIQVHWTIITKFLKWTHPLGWRYMPKQSSWNPEFLKVLISIFVYIFFYWNQNVSIKLLYFEQIWSRLQFSCLRSSTYFVYLFFMRKRYVCDGLLSKLHSANEKFGSNKHQLWLREIWKSQAIKITYFC